MKNETTKATTENDFDIFDITDDIELELVSVEQVKFLLDTVSADIWTIAKEKATRTEKENYLTNRLSRFIDLAIDKIKEIEKNISKAVEKIITIANK